MKIFVFILLFSFLTSAKLPKLNRFKLPLKTNIKNGMRVYQNQFPKVHLGNPHHVQAMNDLTPNQSLDDFKHYLELYKDLLNDPVNSKEDSLFMFWLKFYVNGANEKQIKPYILSFHSFGALPTIKNLDGKTAYDIYEEKTAFIYPKSSLIDRLKERAQATFRQFSGKNNQSAISVKETQNYNKELEESIIALNKDLRQGSSSALQKQVNQIKLLLNNGANIFAKSRKTNNLIIENIEAPWILENLLGFLKESNLIDASHFHNRKNIFLRFSKDREKHVKEVLSFSLYLQELKGSNQLSEASKIAIEPLIELDSFPKLVYSLLKDVNINFSPNEHSHLIFDAMEKAKHPEVISFFAEEIGLHSIDHKNPIFSLIRNPYRKELIPVIKDLNFDLLSTNNQQDSALFYILKKDKEAGDYIVSQLLDTNADIDALKAQTDAQGNNLLHLAARYQHQKSFKKLKDLDFDLRAQNQLGLTPLHELAIHSKESIEKFSFELQDPRILDFKGRTPGVLASFLNPNYEAIQHLVYDAKTQQPFLQDSMQLMFYLMHLNPKTKTSESLFFSHRSNFLSKNHKALMDAKYSWITSPVRRMLNNYLKQRFKMTEMIQENMGLQDILEQYHHTQSILNRMSSFLSKTRQEDVMFRFRLKTNLMHDLLEFNRFDLLSDVILHYPKYTHFLWKPNSLGQSVFIQSFAKAESTEFVDLMLSFSEKELFTLDQWNQSVMFYISLNPYPEVIRHSLNQLKQIDSNLFKVHKANEFYLDEFLFWMNTRNIEAIKPLVENLYFPRENMAKKWLRTFTDKNSYNKVFYQKMFDAIQTNPLLDQNSNEIKDLFQSLKQIKEDL